ncbi:MAG: hypothetical protein DRO39_06720 [Thermoprotei archaeon]|nr:MAG: hypothetical protein DRO39_06720 [Thermoprotei archaeon]
MVMVALNKVVYAVEAGSMRIPEHRAAAVQVVMKTPKMFWVTKPVIVRNVPVTAVRPTPRLAEWRYTFATEASKWRGATGVGTLKQDSRSGKHKAGDTVLAVQAKAQEVLKAAAGRLTKPRAATYDPETGRYRSYIRYRIHTPEELRKLAGL